VDKETRVSPCSINPVPTGLSRHAVNLSRHVSLGVALVCTLVALSGCGRSAGVIFESTDTSLQWPPAPERARIRYIGELTSSADLKPGASFFELIEETLFGEDEQQTLLSPFAVCSDGESRLYVADSNAQLVHMFDLETREYERWTPPRDEPPLTQPVGVACDRAGRLFVSDSVGGDIAVFSPDGELTARIGKGLLERPTGIAIEPATGRIFVTDTAAHQVVVLSSIGEEINRIGERGTDLGQFNYPTAVALDRDGRLLVCDSLNFRVQVFSKALKPLFSIGSKGDVPGFFSQPKGIAVDPENNIYVVDAHFENIQIFSDDGALLMAMGHEGRGPGEFWLPAGIDVDANGRIWVADVYNRRVQVFDYLPEGEGG
jgi:DNA-binding beta-propeller fold protein YncE